jgi:hypothetical protein
VKKSYTKSAARIKTVITKIRLAENAAAGADKISLKSYLKGNCISAISGSLGD